MTRVAFKFFCNYRVQALGVFTLMKIPTKKNQGSGPGLFSSHTASLKRKNIEGPKVATVKKATGFTASIIGGGSLEGCGL